MCNSFGQTCSDIQENTRILLQIYEERNNHLATIIHVSNGLIVAILVGVLAYAGSVKDIGENPFYISLIVAIIVFALITWRVYAHYVDNEIIQVYARILCCEYRLNVESRTSLLLSLVKGMGKSKKKDELTGLIKAKQVTKAYNEMFSLLEKREIGSRGHFILDLIAFIFCILALSAGWYLLSPGIPVSNETITGSIFGLLAGCLIMFILVYPYLPFAKNPA